MCQPSCIACETIAFVCHLTLLRLLQHLSCIENFIFAQQKGRQTDISPKSHMSTTGCCLCILLDSVYVTHLKSVGSGSAGSVPPLLIPGQYRRYTRGRGHITRGRTIHDSYIHGRPAAPTLPRYNMNGIQPHLKMVLVTRITCHSRSRHILQSSAARHMNKSY